MADIRLLETRPAEVQRSVIETLELALADAKSGTIVEVSVAYVRPDGTIGSAYSGGDQIGSMLGALSRLEWRLQRQLDEA